MKFTVFIDDDDDAVDVDVDGGLTNGDAYAIVGDHATMGVSTLQSS
jgi:hypothetical protein